MICDLTLADSLAIFGGAPSFSSPLHVGRPNIGNREKLMERINDMLDRRWLTNDGPFVAGVRAANRRHDRRQALRRHVQRHHRP